MFQTGSSFSWFSRARELSVKYSLPDPIHILSDPPAKNKFRKLVKKKIFDFWHKWLVSGIESKSSLKYIRPQFIPLGQGPHQILLCCEDSPSATEAALVVCQILCGQYKDDYRLSKWDSSGKSSGCCSMPGCGYFPGDVLHYLSGDCPALCFALSSTLTNSLNLLPSFPDLSSPVLSALNRPAVDWAKFVLDPTTDVQVIRLKQDFGSKSIWPLLKLACAFVWTMHRQRTKIQKEELLRNLG